MNYHELSINAFMKNYMGIIWALYVKARICRIFWRITLWNFTELDSEWEKSCRGRKNVVPLHWQFEMSVRLRAAAQHISRGSRVCIRLAPQLYHQTRLTNKINYQWPIIHVQWEERSLLPATSPTFNHKPPGRNSAVCWPKIRTWRLSHNWSAAPSYPPRSLRSMRFWGIHSPFSALWLISLHPPPLTLHQIYKNILPTLKMITNALFSCFSAPFLKG